MIDKLKFWVKTQENTAEANKRSAAKSRKAIISTIDSVLFSVQQLLGLLKLDIMAQAAYNCRDYRRAILYHETFMRNNSTNMVDDKVSQYGWLQKVYFNVDEPDGMMGIFDQFPDATLEQQLMDHKAAGRYSEAQSCYEAVIRTTPSDLESHKGLMECMQHLGHFGKRLDCVLP